MKKIKLNKKDVTLIFSSSRDIGNTYKLEFIVNILCFNEFNKSLTMANIDSISLKKAINNNLSNLDKNYMDLVFFNTKKAVFYLKTDEWLKDALLNVKGVKKLHTYNLVFKLKVKKPDLLFHDPMSNEWEKFIVRKTKAWFNKPSREKKFLSCMFPKELRNEIKIKLNNMFDWEYDEYNNSIVARLKGIWIMAIIVAVTEVTKKMDINKRKNFNKQNLFSTAVKKELSIKDNRKGKFLKF